MRNIAYSLLNKGKTMNVTRTLHTVAGAFILISLALAHYVSPNWLYFTAFVGANLFQSGFTNWCMLSKILKKLGVPQ
jgi:predicted Kef-type K+ transport protein